MQTWGDLLRHLTQVSQPDPYGSMPASGPLLGGLGGVLPPMLDTGTRSDWLGNDMASYDPYSQQWNWWQDNGTPNMQELYGYNTNLRPQQFAAQGLQQTMPQPLLGGFPQPAMPGMMFRPDAQFDPTAVTDLRRSVWPWAQMYPQHYDPSQR